MFLKKVNLKALVKSFFLILAIAAAVFFTGCASIVEGTSQTVKINTQPEQGVSCQMTNGKGTWYVHQTPGTVTVHKSGKPLFIVCSKGKRLGKLIQHPHMKDMVAGNAIFGGLIGSEIDSSDGAAYTYPEQMVVSMHNKSDYINGIYFGP
jgi:hypothetical protein